MRRRDRVVNRRLLSALHDALAAHQDPERARSMQAYMKSAMPYRGVGAAAQRHIWREVFSAHALRSAQDWSDTVLALWRQAGFREERYAAIALAGDRRCRAYESLAALPMYEEMIVTGAWWDYVDTIAAHRLGALLERYPAQMRRTLLRWSRDPHLWKRRASILAQLRFKERTDLALLYACIDANVNDRDFFIRKAIGWALRQYAWTDPAEVVRYVRATGDRLSALSVREALKNVQPPAGRRRGPARG